MTTPTGPLDVEALLVHDDFLRTLARHLLADATSADDAVQETWLAVMERGRFRAGSVRDWLARITRNFALKTRRGEERRRRREERAARAESIPSAAEILERESLRRSVVSAVLSLAEPYRSTMLLRYFENLPPREVARRLAIPVETVRTRTKRALHELRQTLDRDHGGDRGLWGALLWPCAVAGEHVIPWTLVWGAVVMTVKMKTVVVAGVVLLASLTTFLLVRNERSATERQTAAATTSEQATTLRLADDTKGRESSDAKPDLERMPVSATATVPPEPNEEQGTLNLHLVWAEDKTPAASVGVRVSPSDRPDPYYHALSAVTELDGTVSFGHLQPGSWRLDFDRRQPAKIAVAAGNPTEATFEIPPGIAVEGRVVDRAGEAVADAEIALEESGSVGHGRVVGHADVDGRFNLRAIMPWSLIGARKDGYAPSRLVHMDGNPGVQKSIKLVLDQRGSEVRGRVFDPDDRPIAGAIVQIKLAKPQGYSKGDDGNYGTPALGLDSRSDESGAFRFNGVPAGHFVVWARGGSCAPWLGAVDVTLDASAHLDIHLEEPASVSGTITTADGKPARGVELHVGEWYDAMGSFTRSDAQGFFELASLPPGEVRIDVDAEERGRATTTLTLESGESVEWNPVLSTGGEIRGRIVDDRENPLSGWSVEANPAVRDLTRYYSRFARTDQDGRFLLNNLDDVQHGLRVSGPESRVRSAYRDHVSPGEGEVVIHITQDQIPASYLVGKVVGADGKPLGSVHVSASNVQGGGTGIYNTAEHTGAFKFGPLTPGQYRIDAELDAGVIITEPYEVKAGETRDVGDVLLVAGGSIVAELRRGFSCEPALRVWRTDFQWGYCELKVSGDTARSAPLAPGSYAITVSGPGIACAWHRVQVRSGEDTHVEVPLLAGREKTLRCHLVGVETPTNVRISLRDVSGELVLDDFFNAQKRDHDQAIWLHPGSYSVEVSIARLNKKGTTNFTIDDHSTGSEVVDVEVR